MNGTENRNWPTITEWNWFSTKMPKKFNEEWKLSKNGYGIMNIYGKENLSVVSTSQNVQKLK